MKLARDKGDSMLTGVLLGLVLAWAVVTIPSSCAPGTKIDDMDPDRPAVLASPRMTVVMPYEIASQIEITRDRETGRLCYSAIGTTGAAAIWCETYASTLPDSMKVTP